MSLIAPTHPNISARDEPSAVELQQRSLGEIVVIGCILSVIIFLSITGNLLVCVAIYTDRSLRKLGNLFLVSLAIADLLVASLVMVFAVFNDLLGYWMFGMQFCDVWVAFDILCCTASILNLCAISLDRYLHIRDPMQYTRWMSKRVVIGSIAGIWSVSALVSFLPISLGLHKPENSTQTEPPTCAMDLTPLYAAVSSTISFFLPCVVMVALYGRLYMYARMHVRNIRAMIKPLHVNVDDDDATSSPGPSGLNSHHHGAPHHQPHVSDHKAAVTLGFIMGIFLVCWVPFFIVNVTSAFCKTCISELCFKILTWFGYTNSALNPIIYSIFNHDFRRAFRRILTGYGRTALCCANSIACHPANQCRNAEERHARYTHTNGVNGHNSSCADQDSSI